MGNCNRIYDIDSWLFKNRTLLRSPPFVYAITGGERATTSLYRTFSPTVRFIVLTLFKSNQKQDLVLK